jgi:glutathione peroxidase
VDKGAYAFSFKTLLEEKPFPLSQFEGQVLLVVNTASLCGFTPQYDDLEKLYTTYKNQGLVVIGVPSNDFGHQEPGTNLEIESFCKVNYGVSFPMTSKEVVSGQKAHPFYVWAKESFGSVPKWNFHKYLIDRRGTLIDYFNSTTSPDAKRVCEAIEKALAQEG